MTLMQLFLDDDSWNSMCRFMENGEEAIALFESRGDFYYDCILMDIQMPVMDGYEATEIIRAKKSRYSTCVPIVAMTADTFLSDLSNTARANFDTYVIKPVNPDALYERLIYMFSERE